MSTHHPFDDANSTLKIIWSPGMQVRQERRLWMAVMRFHIENGVIDRKLGESAYRKYRGCVAVIDLASIKARELITRHDLKARIDEYNALAGHELIHLGMTSADVVDNVALWRLNETSKYFGDRYPESAWGGLPLLPFRGIKGAVGTQQDQLDLLGSAEKCDELDKVAAQAMGFSEVLRFVGQVYPRSLDHQWASAIVSWLVRNRPWTAMAAGYLAMITTYSGDQWNEGDVSTSVVRRVALPGLAFTADLSLQQDARNTAFLMNEETE